MARVTTWLILINVAVFVLQGFSSDALISNFALWPLGSYYVSDLHATVGFHWWQLITSAFLHANFLHIAVNMYALYLFGHDVEKTLGARYYLALYFSAVLAASLVQLGVITATVGSAAYPTLGASGGVFGILLAFGILFPYRRLVLLFPPIVLPAWLFVTLYGLIELASGILGTEAGVAHFAHLGGMLGGYVVLRHWKRNVQGRAGPKATAA
jgi:membrane associated rhomboid family serine protease